MIIQWLLVIALALTALYALGQSHTPRLVRWANVLASSAGVFFVLQPELTNRIALALGVGRGADLLLYCWVVVSLALFAHLQLALLRSKELMTELARAIALATARRPPPG
jgi:small membrane protein